jgi:hypothetical protein
MRLSFFSLPACWLLLASSLTAQGLVIVEKHGPVNGSQTSESKVNVEGDRLAIETLQNGAKRSVIFLGDAKVMRMFDYSNNSYREMTQQDFERVGDSMAQMRQMMEEKLKSMPPQQRQMVEQMMKQKMGAMAAAGSQAPVVYTKVASGQHVGQWTCDKYDGVRESQKVWEVCTVDFSQFGVQPSDMRVFQQMAEMFKNLMPQGMDDLFKVGFEGQQNQQGFQGVPVHRVSFRNGAPDQQFDITEVKRQDIADSLFEVPEGFKKVAMPQMGGPGR